MVQQFMVMIFGSGAGQWRYVDDWLDPIIG
jgi:hypothetical protein